MVNHGKVDAAIANVIQAGNALAAAKAQEMALDFGRAQVKDDAVARLIAAGKATSVSAAEKIVATDDGFAEHEKIRRTATAETIRKAGEYEAAKLAARFAVSGAEVEGFEPLRLALDKSHNMEMA